MLNAASNYTAELRADELQLIGSTLLMAQRNMPPGPMRQCIVNIAQAALHPQGPQWSTDDVDVICAALHGMRRQLQESERRGECPLPKAEVERVNFLAHQITQKLTRGKRG